LYEKFKEKYGLQDEKENFVKLFKRFLDDCFLPWQKTEAELEELHKMLNSLHPKIQFTMEYDHKKLPFKEKYGQDEKENFVKLFKRFLDDYFLPWQKTEAELKELHKMLNSLHPKIQFTMEYDHKKLPFLDILLYKNAERLESDIHYKQLDTHLYLDYHSCHRSWTYKIKHSLHCTGKTDLCNCNKSRSQE
jgi:tetrahydromethanopterin S-methyltransferase subunit G